MFGVVIPSSTLSVRKTCDMPPQQSIQSEHEVDMGVGHQVGLELGDINIQGTIETEGDSEQTNNLSNQMLQVGVH
jgi:hypothetical protein